MKDFLMKNKWKVALAVLAIFGIVKVCGSPDVSSSDADASYYSNGNN